MTIEWVSVTVHPQKICFRKFSDQSDASLREVRRRVVPRLPAGKAEMSARGALSFADGVI